MYKLVNVYPNMPITSINPPIRTRVNAITLSVEDIRKCIIANAYVEEILNGKKTVQLTFENYNTDNEIAKQPVEEKVVEPKEVVPEVIEEVEPKVEEKVVAPEVVKEAEKLVEEAVEPKVEEKVVEHKEVIPEAVKEAVEPKVEEKVVEHKEVIPEAVKEAVLKDVKPNNQSKKYVKNK